MVTRLKRPEVQPVPTRIVLAITLLALAIVAVAAGFYHQRWQNQLKAYKRLQQKMGSPIPQTPKPLSSPKTPTLDQ